MKNKYTIIIIFILLLSIYFSAVANDLKWAADAEGNAPYIFQNPKNPNELLGFEVDIAKALAEQLHSNPLHIQNQWDGLIPGLYRNDYDFAMNGLEITEEREKGKFSFLFLIIIHTNK